MRRFSIVVPLLLALFTIAPASETRVSAPTRLVLPAYPREMAARSVERTLSFTLEIDELGRVSGVKPMQALSELQEFDSAAMNALRLWQFEQTGKKRDQTVRIAFRMNGAGPRDQAIIVKGFYDVEVLGTTWKSISY